MVIILIILGSFQFVQWMIVLVDLKYNKYSTKVEFLLKMIPGYFIIVAIKGCYKLLTHFILLR